MHLIDFTVGDWSGDGHNETLTRLVWCNKNIEHLREVHFQAEKKLGFNIGDICSDYGDDKLLGDYVVDLFTSPNREAIMSSTNWGREFSEFSELLTDESYESLTTDEPFIEWVDDTLLSAEDVIDNWMMLLKVVDPSVEFYEAVEQATKLSDNIIELINEMSSLIPADNPIHNRVKDILGVKSAKSKSMHFYGYDADGRHLSVPGYGVFY